MNPSSKSKTTKPKKKAREWTAWVKVGKISGRPDMKTFYDKPTPRCTCCDQIEVKITEVGRRRKGSK